MALTDVSSCVPEIKTRKCAQWHRQSAFPVSNVALRNVVFSRTGSLEADAMLVSLKRLVLLLGLVLGSHPIAGAQGIEHRVAFLQSPPLQMTLSSPRKAPPFGSSVLLIQQQGNFHEGYDFRVATNYEHQNPNNFPLFQQSTTPFVTESRLRVAQIWGARLQVNLFVVTFHSGNFMLGPLVSNEAFHRPRQVGKPPSFGLYGIGVSVPLGRNARWESSTGLWRSLQRIVHGGSGGIELATVR
jgi:hypothetical protein